MAHFINEWVTAIIDGSGGLHDFEKYEMATPTIERDEAVANWTIRCLANPKCKGSQEILKAIAERRIELEKMNVSDKWFDYNTELLIKYRKQIAEFGMALQRYADPKNWDYATTSDKCKDVFSCAGNGWDEAKAAIDNYPVKKEFDKVWDEAWAAEYERLMKVDCDNCGGSGYTAEHHPGCSGGGEDCEVYNCPVQVECGKCEATGKIDAAEIGKTYPPIEDELPF